MPQYTAGTGIQIQNDTLSAKISSSNEIGAMKPDGSTVGVAASGAVTVKKPQKITLSDYSLELGSGDTTTVSITEHIGNGTISVQSSDTNIATCSVSGTVISITAVGGGTVSIIVTASSTSTYKETTATITAECSSLKIVNFFEGTDAEIAAMLDAYYQNKITWNEMGWSVGDARKIHLNQMACPNPNSSSNIAAQDITIVIVAHDHNDLATAINGHSKACITVQTREVIGAATSAADGQIYVNGDSSKDFSFTKWSNLYMRTYLNSTVLNAISNTDIKNAIKSSSHNRHTTYNGTASEEVTDTLFLPSYPEIYGTTSNSSYVVTSPTEGTQWEYYQTTANRAKKTNSNGTATSTDITWWMGSASSYYHSNYGYYWCAVTASSGGAGRSYGEAHFGLAPAFTM